MKEIDRLIGLLDDESTEVAENTKAELASMGLVALGPLVAAAPSLQPYGQLSAIEIFEELADPSAGPVLVDLLDSPVATVREWSAYALAHLRVAQAVPALREACRRSRQRGTPPDYSEPVALRHALTELGARRQVQPPLTASLRATAGALRQTWPVARLQEVIDDLADHGQAVLPAPSGPATTPSTRASTCTCHGSKWWQPRGRPPSWRPRSSHSATTSWPPSSGSTNPTDEQPTRADLAEFGPTL